MSQQGTWDRRLAVLGIFVCVQPARADSLAKPSAGKNKPYLAPHKPEESLVWLKAIKEKSMPPDFAVRQPSDAERQTLEQWIRAGGGFPKATSRTPVNDLTTLTAIVSGEPW